MSTQQSKISAAFGQTVGLLLAALASGSALAAFPATTSLSALDGNNGTRLDGVLAGDFLGYSVSKAGDFNHDRIDDFIIGAPNGSTLPGAAYLIYGAGGGLGFPLNLSTLSGRDGFRIDGVADHSQLGAAVADAGDVNGDGVADVIVGAPGESAAYVVFGSGDAHFGALRGDSLDGSNGFRISGSGGSRLGFSVANAGDVNGDGVNDVVVGNGAANDGVGYVIFGRSKDHAFEAAIDVRGLDGGNGFALTSANGNASAYVVTGAGDFNGDGVGDVLIGAWYGNAAYVVFGSLTGFSASVSIDGLNGGNGFSLIDGGTGSGFGAAVAGIGDLNGDGIADIVIGAPMASTHAANDRAGKTYVVFGTDTVFTAPLNVATLNGSNGLQILGAAANDCSGGSVGAAGDLNGDGIADLALGAPYSGDSGASTSGASYVLFGHGGGFVSPQTLTGNPLFANHLDGSNGFQVTGVGAGAQSGWAVAGGGDLNGDGADDLLIGARLAATGSTHSGAGYVLYGQARDTVPPATTRTARRAAEDAAGGPGAPVTATDKVK